MTDYTAVAKELGIKHRIGKYGIEFGRKIDLNGKKYGWKIVHIIPLDGWIFDPHEIIKAIRLDDELGIKNVDEK